MANISIPDEDERRHPESLIQRKVVEATTISSNLVKTASGFGVLSPPVLKDIDNDISHWDDDLPEEMKFEPLMRQTSPMPSWFLVGLYMHLLHLSIRVLKSRTVHANQHTSPASFAQQEMRVTVIEGIQAARSSAKIIEKLLDQKLVFRKSWICINTAYCCATTLLWCSSKAMIFSQPPRFWQNDLYSASLCCKLLEHCATRHVVAELFMQTLSPYMAVIQDAAKNILDGTNIMDTTSPADGPTINSEYLFASPTGSAPLDRVHANIHGILGRPFGGSPQEPLPVTVRAANSARLDARIEWNKQITSVFNGQIRQQFRGEESSNSSLRDTLETIGAGRFVDSREPHGWSGLGW